MDMRAYLAVLATLAVLLALPPATLRAQEDFSGNSFITPYPEGDTYRMQAYGDQYAQGLLAPLADALTDDTRLQVQRKHRLLPGLIRHDLAEELKNEEANKEPLHIAVVMVGANDRFNMRAIPRWLVLGTEEWRQEYGRRVDR